MQVRSADEILQAFAGGSARAPRELANELKKLVGLEPTPPPPPIALFRKPSSNTADKSQTQLSKADGESKPVDAEGTNAPKTAHAMLVFLLILAVATLGAIYIVHPSFFTGR